ncbi:quercetin 2,3-dioxygenase [Alkalinema sp. FACHB-956]|uniref:quercetin 2,3-dioxygenase n=1 Tax=Alkalinema sp. FACHB-956 TaxID=2692768 RepID=UPI0016866A3B|nr:quercetin 2,3-dioxygenase [Alkalinema sp. FACHB-956]MBD2325851.1 quercetin 2,3-dioxygenase [Alkalinema sp. FACHB-956]
MAPHLQAIVQQEIVQQPDQGDAYWVLGDLYRYKARSEDTNHAYALLEITMQPHSAVPPHCHSHEDESFYVLSGAMEFRLGDRVIAAPTGTFVHLPKGQVHQFSNVGSEPATCLCWVTPGGLEKFWVEIGVPVDKNQPPEVTPADIEKVLAIAPRYGLEVIPPSS